MTRLRLEALMLVALVSCASTARQTTWRIQCLFSFNDAFEQTLLFADKSIGWAAYGDLPKWHRITNAERSRLEMAKRELCTAEEPRLPRTSTGTHVRIECEDGRAIELVLHAVSESSARQLNVIDDVFVRHFRRYRRIAPAAQNQIGIRKHRSFKS